MEESCSVQTQLPSCIKNKRDIHSNITLKRSNFLGSHQNERLFCINLQKLNKNFIISTLYGGGKNVLEYNYIKMPLGIS